MFNKSDAKAVTLEDLRKASQLVDESVLRILADSGEYLGATHMQDNLRSFASGHGALQTFALFKANMDGVEALAPLTLRQLHSLAKMNVDMKAPQGESFKAALRQAALDIDPECFSVAPQPEMV